MINICPERYSPIRVGQSGLPVMSSLYVCAMLNMSHKRLCEICSEMASELPENDANLHFYKTRTKTMDHGVIPCFEITGEGLDYFDPHTPGSERALSILACVYAVFGCGYESVFQFAEITVRAMGRRNGRTVRNLKILKIINEKLSN